MNLFSGAVWWRFILMRNLHWRLLKLTAQIAAFTWYGPIFWALPAFTKSSAHEYSMQRRCPAVHRWPPPYGFSPYTVPLGGILYNFHIRMGLFVERKALHRQVFRKNNVRFIANNKDIESADEPHWTPPLPAKARWLPSGKRSIRGILHLKIGFR